MIVLVQIPRGSLQRNRNILIIVTQLRILMIINHLLHIVIQQQMIIVGILLRQLNQLWQQFPTKTLDLFGMWTKVMNHIELEFRNN
jgi:hypothetical protein